MVKYVWIWLLLPALAASAQPRPEHNLRFDTLATRWDEAMPLGNGLLGALVWKKDGKLRLSVDRVDLWDDRPMPGIDQFNFNWVVQQVKRGQYDTVQKMGDAPYERNAAPTKIPGAALEFDIGALGKVVSNQLDIQTGLNTIRFSSGVIFTTYVHATAEYGVFTFENITTPVPPEMVVPAYASGENDGSANSVDGQSLRRLGYQRGTVTPGPNTITYHQPVYDGNYYEVLVRWKQLPGNKITGMWTISNNTSATLSSPGKATLHKAWKKHAVWWRNYWQRSSVNLPEPLLERQYYLDMYKFAAVARGNTPPISLQAVWTADNGKLPPWKGDFHHDLNTQLSYWPGYTANHLNLTEGFTNWLWKIKEENKRWTKQYFGVDGLNVPGVTTISGKPMGGWIQYSLSPTTAAWLSQHFYWQWKYSGNQHFLEEQCKPWFNEVFRYFNNIRIKDRITGKYKLPLSSSPEYNNNSINAWFTGFTNYDLGLVRFFYDKYAEVMGAASSGINDFPFFDTDSTGLTIAPGHPLTYSHRHHSQLISIYPLKVISYNSATGKSIIDRSLAQLARIGTRSWVGYSFPWTACLYAQTGNGDSAVSMLRKFASNFVSINSFHLNGDQKGGQYADATYRPFTLEGNFAFAQAVHELLIQTRQGVINIFPATPAEWRQAAFQQLRCEGGVLVSAAMQEGKVTQLVLKAEQAGPVKVKLPFTAFRLAGRQRPYEVNTGVLTVSMKKNETILITPVTK